MAFDEIPQLFVILFPKKFLDLNMNGEKFKLLEERCTRLFYYIREKTVPLDTKPQILNGKMDAFYNFKLLTK